VAHRLPEYIATHEPSSILDPRESPFSWANDREGKTFYEVLLEYPDRLARFNKGMMTQEAQIRILGIFPFATAVKEIDKSDPTRVFIVDVAGGRGQSLVAIKGEVDETREVDTGRWILQEREAVLHSIPDGELPGIEKMAIDFFHPQPVKSKPQPLIISPHVLTLLKMLTSIIFAEFFIIGKTMKLEKFFRILQLPWLLTQDC